MGKLDPDVPGFVALHSILTKERAARKGPSRPPASPLPLARQLCPHTAWWS